MRHHWLLFLTGMTTVLGSQLAKSYQNALLYKYADKVLEKAEEKLSDFVQNFPSPVVGVPVGPSLTGYETGNGPATSSKNSETGSNAEATEGESGAGGEEDAEGANPEGQAGRDAAEEGQDAQEGDDDHSGEDEESSSQSSSSESNEDNEQYGQRFGGSAFGGSATSGSGFPSRSAPEIGPLPDPVLHRYPGAAALLPFIQPQTLPMRCNLNCSQPSPNTSGARQSYASHGPHAFNTGTGYGKPVGQSQLERQSLKAPYRLPDGSPAVKPQPLGSFSAMQVELTKNQNGAQHAANPKPLSSPATQVPEIRINFSVQKPVSQGVRSAPSGPPQETGLRFPVQTPVRGHVNSNPVAGPYPKPNVEIGRLMVSHGKNSPSPQTEALGLNAGANLRTQVHSVPGPFLNQAQQLREQPNPDHVQIIVGQNHNATDVKHGGGYLHNEKLLIGIAATSTPPTMKASSPAATSTIDPLNALHFDAVFRSSGRSDEKGAAGGLRVDISRNNPGTNPGHHQKPMVKRSARAAASVGVSKNRIPDNGLQHSGQVISPQERLKPKRLRNQGKDSQKGTLSRKRYFKAEPQKSYRSLFRQT